MKIVVNSTITNSDVGSQLLASIAISQLLKLVKLSVIIRSLIFAVTNTTSSARSYYIIAELIVIIVIKY